MITTSRRIFLSGALSASMPLRTLAADGSNIISRQATDFVNSIGVNTHLSSEPYLSRFQMVKTRIADLGIRHLRDELRPSNDIDRWQELFEHHGVRSNMLVSPSTNTIPEMLTYIAKLGREKITAIEGQNEGDADWFMAHKAAKGNWAQTVVDYQRNVFDTLRHRYGADLPVVSPSVINWKPADVALIRDAAPFSDHVAIHSYPQHAEEPETTADYAAVSWYLKHMRDAFKPGAPVMATETGYNTSIKPGGSGVSEKAASIYLPRMLLNNFAQGIEKTFLYQLLDGGDDPDNWEHHFGLVRHDDSMKPSYVAIANLIKALSRPPGAAHSNFFDLRVTLDNPTPLARSVLLSHGDGSSTLALWQASRCWDPAKAIDLEPASTVIKLTASLRLEAARVVIPNDGQKWRQAPFQNSSLEIEVGPKITLLHLTPQA